MASKKTSARALVDFYDQGVKVKAGCIVIGDDELIKNLAKEGSVDPTVAAVKYCKSEGVDEVELVGNGSLSAEQEEAEAEAKAKAEAEAKAKAEAEAKAAAIKAAEDNLQAANESLAAAKSDKDKEAAQNLVNEAQAALDALTK